MFLFLMKSFSRILKMISVRLVLKNTLIKVFHNHYNQKRMANNRILKLKNKNYQKITLMNQQIQKKNLKNKNQKISKNRYKNKPTKYKKKLHKVLNNSNYYQRKV